MGPVPLRPASAGLCGRRAASPLPAPPHLLARSAPRQAAAKGAALPGSKQHGQLVEDRRTQHHDASTSGTAESIESAQASPASPRPGPRSKLYTLLGVSAAAGASVTSGIAANGAFDFAGLGSTGSAIGVLASIVAFHELGHFVAARVQNIHVTKFAIGFGPVLLKYQGPSVEYSLRAIPLGGFCGFPDPKGDPESQFDVEDPDLLRNRPILDRCIVTSAGVLANLVLAFVILLTQVSTVGMAQSTWLPGVRVPDVNVGSVAEAAGVRRGDIIARLDGQDVLPAPTAVQAVIQAIQNSPGRRLVLTVQRGAEELTVPVTPTLAADGSGKIGVQLASRARISHQVARSPSAAVAAAGTEFGRQLNAVLTGLQQLIFNFSKGSEAVSSPVAIVAAGADVARSDATGLFQFASIININLAVVNLLPLPSLDGCALVLLAVEGARGRKLPTVVEQTISASGFLLFLVLAVGLIVRDTAHLIFPQ